MLYILELLIDSKKAWSDLIKDSPRFDKLDDGFQVKTMYHFVASRKIDIIAEIEDSKALSRLIFFLNHYGAVHSDPVIEFSVEQIGNCGQVSKVDSVLSGVGFEKYKKTLATSNA